MTTTEVLAYFAAIINPPDTQATSIDDIPPWLLDGYELLLTSDYYYTLHKHSVPGARFHDEKEVLMLLSLRGYG